MKVHETFDYFACYLSNNIKLCLKFHFFGLKETLD